MNKLLPWLGLGILLVAAFLLGQPGGSMPDAPVAPLPVPGQEPNWLSFPALKQLHDPSWGTVLTDIENHLPTSMGTQYRSSDKITWAHETTHGVHSHLNNTLNPPGDRSHYCFYVLQDRAIKIAQPKITISQVAALVPASLRKSRYHLYLVEQARSWNKEPLYLWDEWVAYTNGAACGIDLASTYHQKTDFTWAVLEFNVYATYVAIAQQKFDPGYDNKQLLAFLAWNLERGMILYHAGQKLEAFNWDQDAYLQQLRTSPEAQELRQFLSGTFGSAWALRVFGFAG